MSKGDKGGYVAEIMNKKILAKRTKSEGVQREDNIIEALFSLFSSLFS
jgi:hypothetical protein